MASRTSLPRLRFLVAAAFALSATMMPTTAKAASYYFNPSGAAVSAQWSDVGNWTDATGVPAATAPAAGDDLFFGSFAGNPFNVSIASGNNIGAVFNTLTLSDLDYSSVTFHSINGYPTV